MSLYLKYPITYFGDETIRDISSKVISKFVDNNKVTSCLFDYVIKQQGERPEDIAYDFYGSCDYVWIVYMCNNIIDPFRDWYMNDEEFQNYMYSKYDSTEFNSIKYYMSDTNIITKKLSTMNELKIKLGFNKIYKVTNYDYEYKLNQNKRNIKLLKTDLVKKLEKDVYNMIGKW